MDRILLFLIVGLMAACSSGSSAGKSAGSPATDTVSAISRPEFDADSAYDYVARQVGFGPRVPGSEAHTRCVDFIVESLDSAGADTVWIQRGTATAFDGTRLPIANVIASFNMSAPRRILLLAHYDTRPWADNEKDESRRATPIDGANDGASGVAVLLEIARALGKQNPAIGVDMLFTDVEDYGTNSGPEEEDSWCLGTQYWADNLTYEPTGRPAYGILLDMVGGRGARFHREYTSQRFAPDVMNRVWGIAASSPYASYFPNEFGGGVTDDHLYVNSAGIPCIDIIECRNAQTDGFPPTWHTLSDNLDNIDRATLKAVGEVLLDVIYTERAE